eukprot:jgi/Mesvir1/9509/Mv05871-RA.1
MGANQPRTSRLRPHVLRCWADSGGTPLLLWLNRPRRMTASASSLLGHKDVIRACAAVELLPPPASTEDGPIRGFTGTAATTTTPGMSGSGSEPAKPQKKEGSSSQASRQPTLSSPSSGSSPYPLSALSYLLSQTSSLVVTSGDDASVRVWDPATGRCLAVQEGMHEDRPVRHCGFFRCAASQNNNSTAGSGSTASSNAVGSSKGGNAGTPGGAALCPPSCWTPLVATPAPNNDNNPLTSPDQGSRVSSGPTSSASLPPACRVAVISASDAGTVTLWSPFLPPSSPHAIVAHAGAHSGPVAALSVASRAPVAVTCCAKYAELAVWECMAVPAAETGREGTGGDTDKRTVATEASPPANGTLGGPQGSTSEEHNKPAGGYLGEGGHDAPPPLALSLVLRGISKESRASAYFARTCLGLSPGADRLLVGNTYGVVEMLSMEQVLAAATGLPSESSPRGVALEEPGPRDQALKAHGDGAVHVAAWDAAGVRAATGGADRTFVVWQTTGPLNSPGLERGSGGGGGRGGGQVGAVFLRRLRMHAAAVVCLAFTPDGTRIASGGEDHVTHITRVADGALLGSILSNSAAVRGLAFLVSSSFSSAEGDGGSATSSRHAMSDGVDDPDLITGVTGDCAKRTGNGNLAGRQDPRDGRGREGGSSSSTDVRSGGGGSGGPATASQGNPLVGGGGDSEQSLFVVSVSDTAGALWREGECRDTLASEHDLARVNTVVTDASGRVCVSGDVVGRIVARGIGGGGASSSSSSHAAAGGQGGKPFASGALREGVSDQQVTAGGGMTGPQGGSKAGVAGTQSQGQGGHGSGADAEEEEEAEEQDGEPTATVLRESAGEQGESDPVTSSALSDDGRVLVASHYGGSVCAWRLPDVSVGGEEAGQGCRDQRLVYARAGPQAGPLSVGVSGDGQLAIAGCTNGTCHVWDLREERGRGAAGRGATGAGSTDGSGRAISAAAAGDGGGGGANASISAELSLSTRPQEQDGVSSIALVPVTDASTNQRSVNNGGPSHVANSGPRDSWAVLGYNDGSVGFLKLRAHAAGIGCGASIEAQGGLALWRWAHGGRVNGARACCILGGKSSPSGAKYSAWAVTVSMDGSAILWSVEGEAGPWAPWGRVAKEGVPALSGDVRLRFGSGSRVGESGTMAQGSGSNQGVTGVWVAVLTEDRKVMVALVDVARDESNGVAVVVELLFDMPAVRTVRFVCGDVRFSSLPRGVLGLSEGDSWGIADPSQSGGGGSQGVAGGPGSTGMAGKSRSRLATEAPAMHVCAGDAQGRVFRLRAVLPGDDLKLKESQ